MTGIIPTDGDLEHAATAAIRKATAGWLIRQRSPQTRAAYQAAVEGWAQWCADRDIDPVSPGRQDCAAWVTWALEHRGWSPSTVSMRSSAIRGWHRELALEGLRLNTDPWVGVRLPKPGPGGLATIPTDNDVRRLLEVARTKTTPAETAIALMATMGLRATEAGMASGRNVQQTPFGRVLAVNGKGGKIALIPLTSTVERAVARVGWPGDKLVGRDRVNADTPRQRVYGWLRRCAAEAEVTLAPLNHSLRHWFVTSGLREGVPLHVMQGSARHADPATTQRYNALRDSLENHAAHTVDRLLE